MPDPRVIPSIEQLRQRPAARVLEARYGREAIVAALRDAADELRRCLRDPETREAAADAARADPEWAARAIESMLEPRLAASLQPSLGPVLNATGVIIHTNLGRAPLAPAALERIAALAGGYTNLEYDLARGARGRRDAHAEALLCRVTGAEAAVVVNNNAAAALIILAALAAGREVIVSRGELVEIGGGFRVPDVMAQSGAQLREVGTTNKARAADYAAAIGERTALILRVHRSNFRIEGFAEQPALEELVALGRRHNVPVVEDLGSGLLRAVAAHSAIDVFRSEPEVETSLAAGADLVCFSGDKLLGGPQAGIILGRRELVEQVRRHPLMRALRVDKLTYAALEGTIVEYAAGRAHEAVPVQAMIAAPVAEIERRARRLVERLRAAGAGAAWQIDVIDGASTIGGGSVPGSAIPTKLVAITPAPEGRAGDHAGPNALEAQLRGLDPPIIARILDDRVVLDLRTILPGQDGLLAETLLSLWRDRSS